jgi:hypothetical protein
LVLDRNCEKSNPNRARARDNKIYLYCGHGLGKKLLANLTKTTEKVKAPYSTGAVYREAPSLVER